MPPASRKPKAGVKANNTRTTPRNKNGVKKHRMNESNESDDAVDVEVPDSEVEVLELDSDALDDDYNDSVTPATTSSFKKRKAASAAVKRKSPSKKRRKKQDDIEDNDSDAQISSGDDEGLTVVGNVVQAPTEGRVPPGQISQNTFNFLKNLAKPECNDREWFKLHELVYRLAEKEWNAWIETFSPLLTEIDDQIPELPPRDVIHRIYRDDLAFHSRAPAEKAFLRINCDSAVIPNGRSIVAAGAWQPGKNELATMRHHIQHNPARLRQVISDPEFVNFFGEPKPHPKGERQNIFGSEDELKTAPKGVAKDHKDIDLLKLRSVAVIHRFLDSEVLAPDFMDQVCKVVKAMKPLVHCLNDMMTLPPDETDSEPASE